MAEFRLVELALTSSVEEPSYDALVVVARSLDALREHAQLKQLVPQLEEYNAHGALSRPAFVLHAGVPSKRLFYVPVSFALHDFDDVRRYRQAGENGISL